MMPEKLSVKSTVLLKITSRMSIKDLCLFFKTNMLIMITCI